MVLPPKSRENINTDEPLVIKDDRDFTHVSRKQVYPMVSNNYKKRPEQEQEEK